MYFSNRCTGKCGTWAWDKHYGISSEYCAGFSWDRGNFFVVAGMKLYFNLGEKQCW